MGEKNQHEHNKDECLVCGTDTCVCTKPFNAESARLEDENEPCEDGRQ